LSNHKKIIRLQADAVRTFSELYLVDKYDGRTEIPAIHDEWWGLCCSGYPRVAIAAPRGHAKSTSITLAYTLASICFRYKRYVVLVANTEDIANDFLAGIRDELRHNKALRDDFGIQKLSVDGSTNCIVDFVDGTKARIRTRGAGQKVRGLLWQNTRPDLVVIDDLEDDEQVDSQERRNKLKNWLMKALFPCISKERGEIRIIGTILHLDSALNALVSSPSWWGKLYKAHNAYNDFSNLLWPEMWTEEKLREKRQEYIDFGDPEGYSQEYLNDPTDVQNPFFREEDFIAMSEADRARPKTYYVGVDFALSAKKYSDYTVAVVGGYDNDGILHIVDEIRVKTNDVNDIINELFYIINRWKPQTMIFEGGVIANAVLPAFRTEQRKRNKYVHVETYAPIQDKTLRAGSIQQRMRSGAVRHDTETTWFDDHKYELKKFPRGKKKDRVDAMAWLGRAIDEFVEAPTQDDIDDFEFELEREQAFYYEEMAMPSVTGY